MSRFVDKNATFQFDLGECQCPPGPEGAKPHARDEASIRKELSYGEVLKLAQSSDEIEASMQLMLMRVKSWSLRDSEGHPVPVSRQAIEDLDKPTAMLLQQAVAKDLDGSDLPNT